MPLIQIDGTQLYGKYQEKLLIATSIDSNGHLLPLAFSVVEEESTDSWGWFSQHLKKLLCLTMRYAWFSINMLALYQR